MFKKINKKGFTLLEMITVIGIFVVILASSLVNFRKGENTSQLRLSGEILASNFRKAQTESLSGIINGEILASGGFGIYFSLAEPNGYLLFRDDGDNIYDSEQDTELETIILPEGVYIGNLTSDPLTILFNPPKPEIIINNEELLNDIEVNLYSLKTEDKKSTVSLNRFTGRIDSVLENRN